MTRELTKDAIKDFYNLYKKHYIDEITLEEAEGKLNGLLDLISAASKNTRHDNQ